MKHCLEVLKFISPYYKMRYISTMPIKIIADYRELLIDIFFAIIIAVGLDGFVRDFLVDSLNELSKTSITLDILFFFAAYFWVISHWVSYHELITKYPYYRWSKFFVDIALFSVMFIIVNISYSAEHYDILLLLVWLLVLWYTFACMWHLSDKGLRPLKLYLVRHILRISTYAILLFLLYDPLTINAIFPSYRDGVTITVILAMILWNAHRVIMFMSKDSRSYILKSMSGYPGRDMPNGGRLELVRYPIKGKLGIQGKDSIKFEGDKLRPLEIFPEDISEVRRVARHEGAHVSDLRLQIVCKHSPGEGCVKEDVKILVDIEDEIISSVEDGIKELVERYNKKF